MSAAKPSMVLPTAGAGDCVECWRARENSFFCPNCTLYDEFVLTDHIEGVEHSVLISGMCTFHNWLESRSKETWDRYCKKLSNLCVTAPSEETIEISTLVDSVRRL